MSRDEKGALARMRIAAIPHPAMLFAFADRTDLKQDYRGPSLHCPKRRLVFLHHHYCNHFLGPRNANPWDRQPFRVINAGQGFPIIGASAVDLFRRLLVKRISHRIDFGADEWRHQCCRTRH